ncbi:MAG: glutamate-5-semialdehyde dehydrogenase [Clostridium baratii]|uniref:Gamma-glutamyl phosphate reductase n=1 Tax=Clostridium baratii str. Sullivan TaxID=1415775 RepID=A0A0A7G2C2_9CLOT|nr:glutamate-5-semialdehyde dehydrogenase [Clostridium baratii]AIY85166.1 glutamate-5-semialdehyde dehydrogenase [Clostridium baratii str. Sullivan]MBS6007791.1 glutamate-5-semialdehyde dehydrogenase [Clostridium baratii]MDU1054585.1 glutamate-5-semialdehyde dehydrogenase [Clostridium baratii]CUP72632.1 gamma-glutamyl phosphate reductase [Clostridium baratii]
MGELIKKGQNAKEASYILSNLSTTKKNEALESMAKKLLEKSDYIINENKKDLEEAKLKGMSESMLDRLSLNENRIKGMADGLRDVINLNDPVGEVLGMWNRPNGLQIGQKRVPIGVIGIIYEARPNVTCDAAGLCLKTGNAVILRGGKEAINSNIAIIETLREGLKEANIPEDAVQLIYDTRREIATEMMRLNDYIDVLIPRGGAGLIKAVVQNATVPVIETGTGNCHIYIDSECDINMAKDIVVNAKTSRPSVCNAAESLVIHEAIANEALPVIANALKEKGVILKGDKKSIEIVDYIEEATEEDYYTEFLDYIISVKIVKDIDEAISHINKHNTGHSEAIVTKNYDSSQKFMQRVDAAAVYVNASTRFTDGAEFGFGAEIGISTQKLHARGPMGLKELTTTKYIIFGNGQIR